MLTIRALVLLLATAVWTAFAAPAIDVDLNLRELTEDNFKASTARGLWLVEHFSPKCGHCRHFAPTWQKLARQFHHYERLSGFYMAQVNCLAQGDLCNRNEIKFYPQLVLYSDGGPIATYNGDRSLGDLSKFIEEHSLTYAHDHLKSLDQSEEHAVVGLHNPDGAVAEVDPAGFLAMKSLAPVLVDFYAPWCPHCKHLRPIYEQLAEELRGKLDVLAVNCDAHSAFCRENGIRGFPTIRLFKGETSEDLPGARTLESMKNFALKSVQGASTVSITASDFDRILTSEDSFFLYLQNFDSALADIATVKATLAALPEHHTLYTSSDPELYTRLRVAKPPPTSSLIAFSNHEHEPAGSLAFPSTQQAVTRFVEAHRFPTLSRLTAANFHEHLKSSSKAVVVLGAFNKNEQGEVEKQKLYEIAKAWKKGGRKLIQPVRFVWVDAEKWTGWLKQSFNIKRDAIPAMVVIDTALDEFYDTTIEGTLMDLSGPSVFSVLEGYYQHFLKPKRIESTFEWGARSATMTLINLSHIGTDHKFGSLLFVIGGVAIFIYLLQKCIPRDPREGGKDHLGRPRLD